MEIFFMLIIGIILVSGFVVLEWVLDNILWIGAIVIILAIISIVRGFRDYKDFGFSFWEFVFLLIKVAAIIGSVYMMISFA
ncbi:MAG: hypothetical protein IKU25_03795 [Clostridia bacterium]|nr:hypothetical protein [Clostridia bacterium]